MATPSVPILVQALKQAERGSMDGAQQVLLRAQGVLQASKQRLPLGSTCLDALQEELMELGRRMQNQEVRMG